MNYLDSWRRDQAEHVRTQADERMSAFLAELPTDAARIDRGAHMTDIEIRHLGRAS